MGDTSVGGYRALQSTHSDFVILEPVVRSLLNAADGVEGLREKVGGIIRRCIDAVIQTRKTGRFYYSQLQNSEKTYVGTAIEIEFRSELDLPRGAVMDLMLAGYEVDLKFTTAKRGWMIPPEALDHPCLLIAASEDTTKSSVGGFVARAQYLNPGANRDAKRAISAGSEEHIWWLIYNEHYPPNFWSTLSEETIREIFFGKSGNERVMMLFRRVRDRPISRKIVEDVGRQIDPTRRVRADQSRGTRNNLASEGIFVLSGTKVRDGRIVKALGLPAIAPTEYLSHQFVSDQDVTIAKRFGLVRE